MKAQGGAAPARKRRANSELGVAREKERMAWELWVNGASYQQIADTRHPQTQLPLYSTWQLARDAVMRARKYRANEDEVEAVRAQRLAGLQAQRLDCIRQLGRVQPVFDAKGQPVMRLQEQPDGTQKMVVQEDQGVRMAIHRTLVMIDKQIASLTGSDAAQRFELVPPAPPAQRDEQVAELKARAEQIRLMPRPAAIEAATRETGTG